MTGLLLWLWAGGAVMPSWFDLPEIPLVAVSKASMHSLICTLSFWACRHFEWSSALTIQSCAWLLKYDVGIWYAYIIICPCHFAYHMPISYTYLFCLALSNMIFCFLFIDYDGILSSCICFLAWLLRAIRTSIAIFSKTSSITGEEEERSESWISTSHKNL